MLQRHCVTKRLLCLIIVLTMMLCLFACVKPDQSSGGKTTGSTTTAPALQTPTTTVPTTQPTTAPTRPPVPPKPMSYELEYVLEQADVDEFYDLLEACEELAMSSNDADEVLYLSEQLEVSFNYIYAQSNIATVLHYSHTLDEALEEQYLDAFETVSDANDAYIQMCRRVYQSDCAIKQELFADWTESEIASLLAYDEQVVQYQKRNAEIGVEYRTSNDKDERIELYKELIQNNNAIAQIYGYDNYYDYAYALVYDRDYGAAEVEKLRAYAKEHLADLVGKQEQNFYASMSDLSLSGIYRVQDYILEDYDDLSKNYVDSYIQAVPENLANAMQTMLDRDSLFTNASDAEEGAFTISLGNRPFCFFGPGYASTNTVAHEGGHYYAALYTELDDIPLDLAEVHSQANEWLLISYLKGKMKAGEQETIVDYMLYENVTMLFICMMVDEFEQRVYTTDVSSFTAADFESVMDDVASKYQIAYEGDLNDYWPEVVVDQPVYYISYAVSGIGAMSLYIEAQENWDDAMVIYQSLCEDFDQEAGFLGNLKDVGLYTPFDEGFYVELRNIINSR